MLWNETELQNVAALGKEIVVERFMKNLGVQENEDIFNKTNFPYLWGLIGVAGVKGTSPLVRHKIWNALVQFGVVQAFDKGVLSDYNRKMADHFNDGRIKAWKGLDNFQASVKFHKTVLEKLVKTDADLAQQVSPYCVDYKKMMEQLNETELNDKLKAYLERFRGMGAACGVTPDAVDAVYEKTDVLRKLCDVAAYTHRKLTEREKDYLFSYLFDAVNDGFSPKSIGLDDAVLAKLMADEALDGLSELEAEPLLARNSEIEDFAAKFEDEYGFFDETEAKFIKHEFGKIKPLTERCLKCIQKDAEPKGVVFAMTLVELNQIKSAVQILLELAKKGRATELIGFLHRLLPKVKGSEGFILDIICMNMQNVRSGDAFFMEYAARRALTATRIFIEAGCPQQAAMLLKYLVFGNWFLDKNELVKQFILFANTLMYMDDKLTQEMCFLAKQLNLRVFETEEGVIIGTDEDNPLSMAKQKLEQFVAGTSMLNWAKYAEDDKKKLLNAQQSAQLENEVVDAVAEVEEHTLLSTPKHPEDKEAVDLAKVAENILNDTQKELPHTEFSAPKELVIPQKIQDKEPERKNFTDSRPTSKIPSSADILRSYAQGESQKDLADDLPTAQLKETTTQIKENAVDIVHEEGKREDIILSEEPVADMTVHDEVSVNTNPNETSPMELSLETVADIITHTDKQDGSSVEGASSDKTQNISVVSVLQSEPLTTIQEEPIAEIKPETSVQNNSVVSDARLVENAAVAPAPEVSVVSSLDLPQTNAAEQGGAETSQQTDSAEQSEKATEPTLAVTPELPKFEEWNNEGGTEPQNENSKKINISSILNINSQEVDKHFEHIKQIATAAVKKAEEQAALIKQKVEDADLANSPSVTKIKAFAQKIKFFRKK